VTAHTLAQLQAGQLAGITRLQLRQDLDTFPPEIYSLADSLEILDLSGNQLSHLPDDLHRLHRLRVIFCSDNHFTELPRALGRCANLRMVGFKANRITHVPAASLPAQLRWLILTDNHLEALPEALGDCKALQKLMLAGNRLRTLPDLGACHRLELVRLAANQLTALPDWLWTLPRLSWLAFAGNPVSSAQEASDVDAAAVRPVPWAALTLSQVLGQGASGVIHQATLRTAEGLQQVAVKLFKGAVTSDGLPSSEMAACLRAGAHPQLISALGPIAGHPQQAPGLVMPLIDPTFTPLAGPPSLDSCTRDVYAPERRFGWDALRGIARGVAEAAAHLHRRGIVHGDVYAHNLLHNGQGEVRLGDFGAASVFDPHDRPLALALQRCCAQMCWRRCYQIPR